MADTVLIIYKVGLGLEQPEGVRGSHATYEEVLIEAVTERGES